jgi:peroxiredoxin
MRNLYLVIPVSAVVITALVVYKVNAPPRSTRKVNATDQVSQPAPLFQLFDDQSQTVRLARYIGRHKLVVVFFDGRDGPDHSPLLLETKRAFAQLHESKVIVLAVSEATPYANREGMGRLEVRFPFPLLSDPDFRVHEQWQAFDSETGRTRPAIFVVDRSGRIRSRQDVGHAPANWDDLQRVLLSVP